MESIQLSLQNFNLAQNRLENTLVRGGSQQQGSWGEFVLKNISEYTNGDVIERPTAFKKLG